MKKITAEYKLDEYEINNLLGKFAEKKHFDQIIDYDCQVHTQAGKPVLYFIKDYIKPEILKTAYESMLKAAQPTNNRVAASGGKRVTRLLDDGTLSRSTQSDTTVESGIAGYFDRNAHYDFCRTTSFTKNNLEKFEAALPLFKAVDCGFENFVPDAYKKQKEMALATHPNYIIKDTAFTTITINKNYRTAYHYDAGDYPQGFGNLVAYCRDIEPMYLVLPKYGVAVHLSTNDLLLVDVHELHGNTTFIPNGPDPVRLSFVMYYREKMYKCLKPSEELKRIQTNKRRTAQKYIGGNI